MDDRAVARHTLVAVGVVAAVVLAFHLRDLLAIAFTALVLASAIRPRVESLRRRGLPHSAAVALVYLVLGLALAALLMLVVPRVLYFAVEVVRDDLIGRQLRALAARLTLLSWKQLDIVIPVVRFPAYLQGLIDEAGTNAGRATLPLTMAMMRGIGGFGLVLVLAYYWLLAREPTLRLALRVVPPRSRLRAVRFWTSVEQRLGAWMRGQLTVMVLMGGAVLLGLLALGVPYAIPLAVMAGLFQAVPMLGPILSYAPIVLVALTVSSGHAVLALGYLLLLQQIDNAYVTPRVMQHTTGLNPLVVILAVVAGGMLGGIVGALLGVPVAAVVHAVLDHMPLGEEDRAERGNAPTVVRHSVDDEAGGADLPEPEV